MVELREIQVREIHLADARSTIPLTSTRRRRPALVARAGFDEQGVGFREDGRPPFGVDPPCDRASALRLPPLDARLKAPFPAVLLLDERLDELSRRVRASLISFAFAIAIRRLFVGGEDGQPFHDL